MCGITGGFGLRDRKLVESMTEAVRHRGPDATGHHFGTDLQLGSARLSIIDVDGGNQPIYNETGEICAVVNGEIYNYRELRDQLAARGHRLTTGSDSEVVVHLYEDYGERCVDHLRGMFAVAIADRDRLFLARDRLGIKPLYYTVLPGSGALLFASEIKALLRCPDVHPELDMQAFADWAVLTYVAEDRTLLEGIRSLLPGHVMTVTPGEAGPRIERVAYHEPPCPATRLDRDQDREQDVRLDAGLDEAADRLLELLRETVRSHLLADVEIGVTLSGGLDSALLAVLMRETTDRPFRVFSVADHAGHPDAVQATRLAAWLGCPHEVMIPRFRDYVSAIPSNVRTEETLTGLGSLPLYMLCARMGADLKVCLNGEGADELFGGYPEYLGNRSRARHAERTIPVVQALGLRASRRAEEIIEVLGRLHRIDADLSALFAVNLREELTLHHLETLDKNAMAHGVEMRVPYMDHEVVGFVNALPVEWKVDSLLGIQKRILKLAALKVGGHSGPLADSILRRKIGGPAAGSQYRAMFDRLCERTLPDDYLARHELGRCFSTKRELLIFELFDEILVNHRGAVPDDFSMLDFVRERTRGRPLAALVAD